MLGLNPTGSTFADVVVLAIGVWGVLDAPFDWNVGGLPRTPVPVDALVEQAG